MTPPSVTNIPAPASGYDNKTDTEFHIFAPWDSTFTNSGLNSFDDIWNLPAKFVEDVNFRRGGWSAVSRLKVESSQGSKIFYVKRQENQLRRSWMNPIGKLTFYYELSAINRNWNLNLPSVEVVCFGIRKSGNNRQAILVSLGLDSSSLAELSKNNTDKRNLLHVLEIAGKRLYEMHTNRISHGALYPNHLYLNPSNYTINLIDFERSRICLTPQAAIKRDLSQFLKRSAVLRDDELNSFLSHYRANYPELTNKLIEKFHVR